MTAGRATWLADVLRLAGLKVVEHDGWKGRGHGDFVDLSAVVWHHDASPVGPSPGVPGFMLANWAKAAANCWVALDGTWHVLAAGVSYHAGKVLPGKPDNWRSIGVETDHTTGETWSGVYLLESLRLGTAAILRHLGEPSTGLEFHRTICAPVGRKSDPDGLFLNTERAFLDVLMQGAPVARPALPAPTITDYPENDVQRIDIAIDTDQGGRGYRDVDVPASQVVSVLSNTANPPTGGYKPIPDVARLDVGGKTRVVVEEAVPNGRIDVTVWRVA